MPFVDVPTTARKPMTPTRALKAWENTGGVCVTCNVQIDGTKEKWFVEHKRALELGGADDDINIGPAHFDTCKKAKDAEDHANAAQAKRRKRVQLGIKKIAHRLPGCRTDDYKLAVGGGTKPRHAPVVKAPVARAKPLYEEVG